jgi:FkbM family methyltransferase
MSIRQGIMAYYKMFGFGGLWYAAAARISGQHLPAIVSLPGIYHPLHLRARTTDIAIFNEVIIHSEYNWGFLFEPKVIVDAGANIGLSSIFFARKYPTAKILAIEPETGNFEILLKNVSSYPNIIPVQGALWGQNCEIDIHSGTGAWGFQTRDKNFLTPFSPLGRVRGITLDRLLDEYDIPYIDILKADIEGSEVEVFGDASRWINKVGTIIIELHDRFRSGCSRSFYAATTEFRGEWHKGEITVVSRDADAVLTIPTSGEDMSRLLPLTIRRDRTASIGS